MSMTPFPPLAELLPQTGRMRLLDRILAHDPEHTVCSVDVHGSGLFRSSDRAVPAWVGVEYMAQCIAAHGGMAARERGGAARPGLFLGSRRLVFRTDDLDLSRGLEVSARHLRGDPAQPGLLAFQCALRDPEDASPLAEGQLNVYVLESFEAFRQGTASHE